VIGRTQSGESAHSQGQKLVWKRGPNNRFDRYPDSDAAAASLDEEDVLMAEALKRSLQDM
jgi:hypothetical protein